MSKEEVKRAIEAILMVVDEPLSDLVLAQIIEVPRDEIGQEWG
jgi:segregation and condensation protein B